MKNDYYEVNYFQNFMQNYLKIQNYFKILIFFSFITASGTNSQWNPQVTGTSANLKSIFFFNALTGFCSGSSGILLKTTNGGLNWNQLSSGLSSEINSLYFINSNTGFASANGGSMIMTTNAGANWSSLTSGVTDNLYSISFSGSSNGVCSGSGGTLLFTSNGGFNWTIAANGFLSSYYGVYMFNPATAYAGGVNTIFQPLLARTTNGGANWVYSSFYLNGNEGNLRDFHFFSPSEGIAVSNVWDGRGGISITTNGGVSWTTQFSTSALNSVDFSGSTGYSVGINGSIIKSTDAGATWQSQSSGVSVILRGVDFADTLTGYVCGDGGVILKTTNGGVTSVQPVSGEIPVDFELNQNYPNPFNPSTRIRFSVPGTADKIVIQIYDDLGREVSLLYNGYLKAGIYELDWNANGLSSGIYYCRLQSGHFAKSIRMTLLK